MIWVRTATGTVLHPMRDWKDGRDYGPNFFEAHGWMTVRIATHEEVDAMPKCSYCQLEVLLDDESVAALSSMAKV